MAITNHPGKGTQLQLSVSAVYYAIGQIVKLDGPDPELKTRDITALDSTYVGTRPAIPDLGTLSGTLIFDPNDTTANVAHGTLRAKVYTPPSAPDLWKLVYVDGLTTPAHDMFSGYLTKWKITGIEVEGTVQAEFEIRLTDTWSATAGA